MDKEKGIGRINTVTYCYMAYISMLDPSVRVDDLITKNKAVFNALGIPDDKFGTLAMRLKSRYSDWRKYGFTYDKSNQLVLDVDPGDDVTLLDEGDLELIKAMTGDHVGRIPINDLSFVEEDGKEIMVTGKEKEKVDMIVLETYTRGHFASMFYPEADVDDVKKIMDNPKDNVHVWVYGKIHHKPKPPKVKVEEPAQRAF